MSGRSPLAMGAPPAKAKNFGSTVKRLADYLKLERRLTAIVAVLGFVAVALSVIGPKILGHATDLVFTGFVASRLPPGSTKAEAVAGLRARGDDQVASMVQAMDLHPGRGIDFQALGWILVLALVVYLASSLFMVIQGRLTTVVVQHTVARLRAEAEDKLSRLPLAYFDRRPHGEVLS
ncbi:MAG: ATP-binding cassette, subfamily multidrug efflux pump, partial [Nocardioidaceae bacterium]|nr:ATP-binding cassette, subfamily multidrug efflux pump [Nocardioidaceae bacterium]